MSTHLVLARRDFLQTLRHRETWLWVFAMPLVFFYFFGTISGGSGGSGESDGPPKTRLVLSPAGEAGFLGARLERRLSERDFEVVRAANAEEFSAAPLRLELPAAFTRDVLARRGAKLVLAGRGDGLSGDFHGLAVRRAAYTLLADVVAASELSGKVDETSLAALDARPRTLALVSAEAGARQRIPAGFEQTIPGTMTMMTLLVMVTTCAAGLLVERRQGLLRRLASAPLSRREIVTQKWLAALALGIVQLGWGMLAGSLFFGVRWGPALPMILVVLLAWASLCAAIGLLAGSLAKSEGQAIGLGVLTTNVLAALGGCWWPIEVAPRPLQRVAEFLPTGWTMEALHKLVSFGNPWHSALPQVALLVGATLVVGALVARVFRFD